MTNYVYINPFDVPPELVDEYNQVLHAITNGKQPWITHALKHSAYLAVTNNGKLSRVKAVISTDQCKKAEAYCKGYLVPIATLKVIALKKLIGETNEH